MQNANSNILECCVEVPCFNCISFGKTFSDFDPDKSKTGLFRPIREASEPPGHCGRFRLNFTCIYLLLARHIKSTLLGFHYCGFLCTFQYLLNAHRSLISPFSKGKIKGFLPLSKTWKEKLFLHKHHIPMKIYSLIGWLKKKRNCFCYFRSLREYEVANHKQILSFVMKPDVVLHFEISNLPFRSLNGMCTLRTKSSFAEFKAKGFGFGKLSVGFSWLKFQPSSRCF